MEITIVFFNLLRVFGNDDLTSRSAVIQQIFYLSHGGGKYIQGHGCFAWANSGPKRVVSDLMLRMLYSQNSHS